MPEDEPQVGAADVLAFVGELALLAALAVAGSRLADGLVAVVLAVGLPLLLAVAWGRWLAPRASRRVAYPGRLLVKLGLTIATAGLLAGADLVGWSVVLLVGVGSVFAVSEVRAAGR